MPRRSSLLPDYQRDWPEYYTAVEGKPPRDTLLRALSLFEEEWSQDRLALDVGCGSGRDAHELLKRGWSVWASDSNELSEKLTLAGAPPGTSERLTYIRSTMEALPGHSQVPRGLALINASFALPFCQPESFPAVWSWIGETLVPGGRFAGQFFGDRDEWACVRPKSHFTRAELETLLTGWSIEHLEEVEKEGDDATGKPKYHHVFHVVVRKSSAP
ncbi:MAG: class I SAM-dependent methyltransferase [Planctomycetes bacterium]|nr:class I SAM-dependent methyltransferase [Planctomycetota bacterium]